MTTDSDGLPASDWPLWRRIVFRYFFVYLGLQIAPWDWLGRIPGVFFVLRPLGSMNRAAVEYANSHLFHTYSKLILPNGSGDTSFAWTEFKLYLVVAAVVCVLWSAIDFKRTAYPRLDYWFRTVVRYYICAAALSYGLAKVYDLQMPFPLTSQLATPLGDLLPMRFSWLFIGYSTPYEMFGGWAEFMAGLLLLNRRTVTLGLLAAAAAFGNVVMINLAYDVPVKLYSMHLFFCCIYLLLHDAPRLFNLFVLNRAAASTALWQPLDAAPWQRYARWGLKAILLWGFLYLPYQGNSSRYAALKKTPAPKPFAIGVYDVQRFSLNGKDVPPLLADSMRWRNVIFDSQQAGSVETRDSVFWQRYRRGYFRYKADTLKHTVAVWKTSTAFDSTWMFSMRYEMPDSNTIRFWTKIRTDSVFMELVRTNRHFQLAEKQFHWLSEYNR